MDNEKQEIAKYQYSFHAMTSSGGTMSLSLFFSDKAETTREDQKRALAFSLANCYEFMLNRGFLSGHRFDEYGKGEYWKKLLNEGKIPYKEDPTGRIVVDLWVPGYVDDKEKVNEYVHHCSEVVKLINESERTSGAVACPKCKEKRFEFNVNVNGNTNGICRACSFHIHTMR